MSFSPRPVATISLWKSAPADVDSVSGAGFVLVEACSALLFSIYRHAQLLKDKCKKN